MSDMSESTIRDIESISYERISVTTTSPTHESMPHILCEVVRHLSDSTNHMSESLLEGVSEPQHIVSEVVDTVCDAEHPSLIPMGASATPPTPLGPMTRARAKAIEDKVNSLLSELPLTTHETWLLPHSETLCV